MTSHRAGRSGLHSNVGQGVRRNSKGMSRQVSRDKSRVKIQERNHSRTPRKGRLASIGAIVFGAGGVAAASAIGVGELAVGAFVAYVAYRIIRYGVPPTEAILEGVELEHGEVPKNVNKAA